MGEIAQRLQKTDLFREVDLLDLEALVNRMKGQSFPQGAVLFQADDPGDTMYIIQSGRIRIFMHDTAGNEITLTHYGESEVFGELSPIDSKPRSASASAAEALEVMALNRNDFLNFLEERPQIGIAMMRSLSQRLRNTTTYLEEFKPAAFETKQVEHGEDLRRGASDLVANILDNIASKPETLPEQNPESPTSSTTKPTMGIFDRIAIESPPPSDKE